jgi:hypothetical protein
VISRDAARKRGRRNKAVGDAFESWVDGQHEMAMRLGIFAHVEHNQAHAKVVNGQVIYEKPGVADYTGCLESVFVESGYTIYNTNSEIQLRKRLPAQYLACEAKSTDGDRLPRSKISPKQQEHLTAVARAGGLALLVIEFRHDTPPVFTRYAVPWLEIKWTVLRTAESVAESDISQWQVQPGTCYLSRWHPGGPRSSNIGGRGRVYATE